jgi:predicted nucleic acid-binding protein
VTRLEIGYSARSGEHLRRIFGAPPVNSLVIESLTPSIEDRALQVQALLVDRGLHRSPSLAHLLVAAVAEARGLTVLHFEKAFKDIAGATGQPVEQLRV